MASWLAVHVRQIVTSAGLCADIVGAIFVAVEVVRQFPGPAYRTTVSTMFDPQVASSRTRKTPEFEQWESWKYSRMKWGLGCLLVGFVLQFIGVWLR